MRIKRLPSIHLDTERLYLRLPEMRDYEAWCAIQKKSEDFLTKWEPKRDEEKYSLQNFKARVVWAISSLRNRRAIPLFIFRNSDDVLIGAITVDNVRFGAAHAATIGYWIGVDYARQGYMREAVERVKAFLFSNWDLSRLEAACLPENNASRGLLETCGFKYEGVAQAYLQINGRWRTHVLYAALRRDRLGKTNSGQ